MTIAGDILDNALDVLVVFDQGRSEIGEDETELLKVLNKRLAAFYADASAPVQNERLERNDFFATITALTGLDANTEASLPTDMAWQPLLVMPNGDELRLTTQQALLRGRAELPPAAYIRGITLRSCQRTGDPVQNDVITAHYTQLPGTLTDRAHFIGATTVTNNLTSLWEAHLGDEWLEYELALYLATKSGDVSGEQLQVLATKRDELRLRLLTFVRRPR